MDYLYLGPPGALRTIHQPRGGVEATVARRSVVHQLAGGGLRTQFLPGAQRRFRLSYQALLYDDYRVLEELYLGMVGPGPFVLVDPGRGNLLSADQAAATSILNDSTGFTPSAGETVDSHSGSFLRGPRAAVWSLPNDRSTAGLLTLDPPAGLPGYPAIPDQPHRFGCELAGAGADPQTSVRAALVWLRSDGSPIAAPSYGTPATLTGGAWTTASVAVSAPPDGAVYLTPRLEIDLTTITAGASGRGSFPLLAPRPRHSMMVPRTDRWTYRTGAALALDDWLFGSTVDVLIDQPRLTLTLDDPGWTPGTGIPQVSFLSLTDSFPWREPTLRTPVEAVLQEVTS